MSPGRCAYADSNPLVVSVGQKLELRQRKRGNEFPCLWPGLNADQVVLDDAVVDDVATGHFRARYVDVLPVRPKVLMLWELVFGLRPPLIGATNHNRHRFYKRRGVPAPRGLLRLGPNSRA